MDGRSVMLSFQGGSPSASSGSGIGTDDHSLTDTCQLVPRPLPFDAHERHSFSQRDGLVSRYDKSLGNSQDGTRAFKTGSSSSVLHLGSFKREDDSNVDEEKAKLSEYDKSRPGKPSFWMDNMVSGSDDEELCPTCLEEYTTDNPKILTSCSHHFHLGCIYEWMERSDKCPMCGKEMEFCESLP
ncbi:E3 ubiquitin-protein ligase At3g02290-like isoform X2 [Wolffia australiana]